MRNNLIYGLFFIALISCHSGATRILWQTGDADSSAAEFALAPNSYSDFLNKDFGWEDRFFLVGKASPQTDFPYIMPGPLDAWGGSAGGAGVRTQTLNLLFGLKDLPSRAQCRLIIDILDAHEKNPPLLKVTVNGHPWKFVLPAGSGRTDGGRRDSCLIQIAIPLDPGILRRGGNEINLTTLEGSWLIFDCVRLETDGKLSLRSPDIKAFVRSVQSADYQIDSATQPLLVDVEHLEGRPTLSVKLDGRTILEQTLEKGRYVLEAPMPAVAENSESRYSIFVDNEKVDDGKICRSPQKIITPADYVNTFAGTAHSRWMIAPGPWMPFSMVKLSPDNENAGWQAGYQPSFESVGTFSHIHEWTMAGLGMMPVTGVLKTKIGDQSSLKKSPDAYRSQIDKQSEAAPLGYYRAFLSDYGIIAELTATTRCGLQRYTYPKGSDARVMIDLKIPAEYNYDILESQIKQVGKRRIEGYSRQQSKNVWSSDTHQDYTVHFVIDFDRDICKFGGWVDEKLTDSMDITAKNPSRTGCYVEFDVSIDSVILAASAISYVDMDGARLNLETEITRPFGWNFDAVRQNNINAWNDLLGRVRIECNDRREKCRFYTNLYRAFCRNTFSDVDGRWTDAAEQTQHLTDPDAVALGCDAFWNTFWNLNQVWNLVAPEWSARWVKSQLAMYDANGWLAKGPAGMEYVPVMVAEHEIPLMVSAYQMGIRNYDTEKMYRAVRKMQTILPQHVGGGLAGNRDLSLYLKYHYVPAYQGKGNAWQNARFSNTLEYSFDDWTVSQLAKAMEKEADYKMFAERGNWWRNAIEPKSGYARLRYADGSWASDFDPFKSGVNDQYVEGNGWQLTFFVPQDVPALVEVVGKQRFIDRLEWGFKESEIWRYNAPNEQYGAYPVVHGNQQSMHFAFLFNWAGQPWQTQRWVRSIIDRYYGFDISNAYLGDEDQGQMSAWFVMAALGLFQTDGGCRAEPVYELGSPLFRRVTIDLGERFGRGKTFVIEAENASRTNIYIQSAELNGRPLDTFCFPARELLQGGTLKLKMGEEH